MENKDFVQCISQIYRFLLHISRNSIQGGYLGRGHNAGQPPRFRKGVLCPPDADSMSRQRQSGAEQCSSAAPKQNSARELIACHYNAMASLFP